MDIDAKILLKRYCFLGSFDPIRLKVAPKIEVDDVYAILEAHCMTVTAADLREVLTSVFVEASPPRFDEAALIYAIYLTTNEIDAKHKTKLRAQFNTFIDNEAKLFVFAKYARKVLIKQKRKAFNTTVRKAITLWYKMQTPESLQQMWLSHRRGCGFPHRRLMKLCHLGEDTLTKSTVAMFFKTCTELLENNESKVVKKSKEKEDKEVKATTKTETDANTSMSTKSKGEKNRKKADADASTSTEIKSDADVSKQKETKSHEGITHSDDKKKKKTKKNANASTSTKGEADVSTTTKSDADGSTSTQTKSSSNTKKQEENKSQEGMSTSDDKKKKKKKKKKKNAIASTEKKSDAEASSAIKSDADATASAQIKSDADATASAQIKSDENKQKEVANKNQDNRTGDDKKKKNKKNKNKNKTGRELELVKDVIVNLAEIRISSPAEHPTKVMSMAKLRTTSDMKLALKIIKECRFGYGEIPKHLFRIRNIAKYLLSGMSYNQLLKYWKPLFLGTKAMPNKLHEDPEIHALCLKTLAAEGTKEDMHPLQYLLLTCYLQGRVTILHSKRRPFRTVDVEILRNNYRLAFGRDKPNNLRMNITMNLSGTYYKKLVRNYQKLSYFEVAIGMALGYYKMQKRCDVECFTADARKLHRLDWKKKSITIQEAYDVCDMLEISKSKQDLTLPIKKALQRKMVYDVFLTIVPAATRGNKNQCSDSLAQVLNEYREAVNPSARYVIVDLLRYKKSMQYSQEEVQNILEICGVDKHTNNLIEQFALHKFD